MIRILLDQGIPRSTARLLRAHGWDTLHVGDIGMSCATDVEIIGKGLADQRVIVTLDSDFHAYLAVTGAQFPSTIRVRIEGLRGDELASLLIDSWKNIEQQLIDGAMITITGNNIRIRRLPIGEDNLS